MVLVKDQPHLPLHVAVTKNKVNLKEGEKKKNFPCFFFFLLLAFVLLLPA